VSHRFVAVAPPHVGCVSSHSRTLLPTSVALPAEQLRRLSVRLKHLPAHFGAVHAPRDTESTPVVQDVDAAIEAMHQASFDLVSLSILAPSPAIPRRLASARETLRCAGSCVVCLRWRVNSLQPSSLPPCYAALEWRCRHSRSCCIASRRSRGHSEPKDTRCCASCFTPANVAR